MLTKQELDHNNHTNFDELKEYRKMQAVYKKRNHKFDGSVNRRGLSKLLCDVFAQKETYNRQCIVVAQAKTDAERMEAIAETVVNVTGFDLEYIREAKRGMLRVDARRLIIFFGRWVTKYGTKAIGAYVSSGIRKDHATILYNTEIVVDKLKVNDEQFVEKFMEVKKRLAQNYDIVIDLENPATYPNWYKRLLQKNFDLSKK